VVEITSGKPYFDERVDKYNFRTFSIDAEDSHYVWHRDQEYRQIEVMRGNGWQFQWENALPWLLVPGQKFRIDPGEYHRIIKGVDDLVIRITPIDK
jgi:hypothetical protein